VLPTLIVMGFFDGGRTLCSWWLTTDHKRIGLLYVYSIVFFFTIAAIAAALMRMELITPPGDLVTSETYNKLFTIHGTLMVWFFLTPSVPAVPGNFIVPLMLGARGPAFPRLNLLSWHLFNLGGLAAISRQTNNE
jgi:cytochrome c oxidase subunit 1